MRLEFLTVVAALAATCAADSLAVWETCLSFGSSTCTRDQGAFFTSNGGYSVNPSGGCTGTGVPGMVEFCMDWPNNRGHFRFSHQSFKRCLGVQSRLQTNMCNGCSLVTWTEIPCTWRMLPIEPEATESAPPTLPTTTLVPLPRISSDSEDDTPLTVIPGNMTVVAAPRS